MSRSGGMTTEQRKHPKGKGCWYFISYHECPICGRGPTYRERRWTRKPKRWQERQEFIFKYDYCDVL